MDEKEFKTIREEIEGIKLIKSSYRSIQLKERLRMLQNRYNWNKHKFQHLICQNSPVNGAKRNQKYRERMTEEARDASLNKKAEANKKTRQDKRDIEQAPQAPDVSVIHSSEGRSGRSSARPTCAMDGCLELRVNVNCFPAPTYTWTKDGKMIGCEIGGGEVVQKEDEVEKTEEVSESEESFDEEDRAGVETKQKLPQCVHEEKFRLSSFWIFKGLPVKYQNGKKDRTLHRNSNSKLEVSNLELSDAGNYKVKVKNEHGTAERSIKVDFTPTLVKDINMEEVTVRSGGEDKFRLEVNMSGGEVKWYNDGEQVVESKPWEQRIIVSYARNIKGTEDGIFYLEVQECEFKNAGTYVAKVESKAGQCSSSPCVVTVVQGTKKTSKQMENLEREVFHAVEETLCSGCHEPCDSGSAYQCKTCLYYFSKICGSAGFYCRSCATLPKCRFCKTEYPTEYECNVVDHTYIMKDKLGKAQMLKRKAINAEAPEIWTIMCDNRRLGDKKARELAMKDKEEYLKSHRTIWGTFVSSL